MIIKERIQKADGSIRFRNYLKQEKLGKGFLWSIQGALQSVSRWNAWRTRNCSL